MDNTEEKIKELINKIQASGENIESILMYFKEIVNLDKKEKFVDSYVSIFKEIYEQLPEFSDKKIELWNLANYGLQINNEEMLNEVLYIARKNPEKYIDILYGTKPGRLTMLENIAVVNKILEQTFEKIQDEKKKRDIISCVFSYGVRPVRGTDTELLKKAFEVLQKLDNPEEWLTSYNYIQIERKAEIGEILDIQLINEKIKGYINDKADVLGMIIVYNELEKSDIRGLEVDSIKLQVEKKLKENPIETLKTLKEYNHINFENFGHTVIEILSDLQEKGEDISEYNFDITLSTTQLRELIQQIKYKKISKGIKFDVSVKKMKDFLSEEFENLKESIGKIKFKNQEYSFEEFVACKNVIEKEILESVDFGNQDDPDREKKIFKQVIKKIAKKVKYDYATIKKDDQIRKLKENLKNPEILEEKKKRIKEKIDALRAEVKAAGTNNMIGALIRGKAVCAGYAHINAIVFECLGIEAKEINGFPEKEDVGHAWNQIKLDGEWYNFDLTWERDNICMGKNPMFILKNDEEFEDHDKYIKDSKSNPEKCETSLLKQKFNVQNIVGFKPSDIIVNKSEKIKNWIKRAAKSVSLADIDRVSKNIQNQVTQKRKKHSNEER